MVAEVWLHIGTPKSGTSSLQKYVNANRDVLAGQGLAYLSPPGKVSANDLAVAFNNNRPDKLAELAAAINGAVEGRPEAKALISSEMFYGMVPEDIFGLFPALSERPLHVLVYLRRQDRYIEAKYLQKSKNARFNGTIQDYIRKFDGSGSDYAAMLKPWQDYGGNVTLVPRVLERARLTGGDVVADAMSLLGVDFVPEATDVVENVSPGLHRVQLLQAAARAGLVPPRKLQRLMAVHYPQDPGDRAPVMSQSERREYLGRFAKGNEALRACHFPDWPDLFDCADLSRPVENEGIAPFTKGQLTEITKMLKVMKQLVRQDK